ncbi:MAG: NifB/NifX family molybdenum-iron cluster-binding protein, partial [Pseudomonadota bacterium]
AAELKKLQDACAGGANLMKHCRQCRADAVGLLGEDRGQEFTMDLVPDEVEYDPSKREQYREWVAEERGERQAAAEVAKAETAAAVGENAEAMLIAVATKGGGRINQHFGHATEFQIFEVDADGVRFVTHRRCDNYCVGGYGEEDTLELVIKTLEGINTILCAKIGDCPREALEEAGIEAIQDYAYEYIETAVSAVYREKMGLPAEEAAIA